VESFGDFTAFVRGFGSFVGGALIKKQVKRKPPPWENSHSGGSFRFLIDIGIKHCQSRKLILGV